MLEVFLDSEPTINESIAMAGAFGQTQAGKRNQVERSKEVKANEAIGRFDKVWGQGASNQ